MADEPAPGSGRGEDPARRGTPDGSPGGTPRDGDHASGGDGREKRSRAAAAAG